MIPYFQGYLDGLCGVYSIINAMRIVLNLSQKESAELFKQILKFMEERKRISSFVVNGLHPVDMQYALRRVIEPKYPITWNRPYLRRRNLKINRYWKEMLQFISEDDHRAVIMTIQVEQYSHWSVVHTITEKQLRFFDSAFLAKRVNRNRCAIRRSTAKRPYAFQPGSMFFLSKSEKG
jgi:hypothetical protein